MLQAGWLAVQQLPPSALSMTSLVMRYACNLTHLEYLVLGPVLLGPSLHTHHCQQSQRQHHFCHAEAAWRQSAALIVHLCMSATLEQGADTLRVCTHRRHVRAGRWE